MIDGILLIDKPAGISSFGVVARIRWLIKEESGQKIKIGHTGTLDPAATGLMILVLGKYTKRAAEFSKLDKTYEVELTLGKISTTADSEGEITDYSEERRAENGEEKPPRIEIEAVLKDFVGVIDQIPPIFSAIKIDGKRAYKLARAGQEVKLEPRKVTIYDIKNIDYDYPKLRFTTSVSSGTYIRSLAVDIGAKLGTGAYMSALRRIKVGDYTLEQALAIDKITFNDIINNVKQIPSK
jgi:tRNA pseudouridine55 synthase